MHGFGGFGELKCRVLLTAVSLASLALVPAAMQEHVCEGVVWGRLEVDQWKTNCASIP